MTVASLTTLPNQVLSQILGNLDERSMVFCKRVSKRLGPLAQNELWEALSAQFMTYEQIRQRVEAFSQKIQWGQNARFKCDFPIDKSTYIVFGCYFNPPTRFTLMDKIWDDVFPLDEKCTFSEVGQGNNENPSGMLFPGDSCHVICEASAPASLIGGKKLESLSKIVLDRVHSLVDARIYRPRRIFLATVASLVAAGLGSALGYYCLSQK